MSTQEAKPVVKRVLNSKLLPIAALSLVVLALLFMATPLLRASRGGQRGAFGNPGNGQGFSQNGTVVQGGSGAAPQFFSAQGGANPSGRRFVFGGGLLGGATGAIVYFIALLISLAAAVGMLYTKRWGQVLGIIMAVLYGLLGLVSLLPILLASSLGIRNPLSLILGILHVALAIAVIVLASIPARQVAASAVPAAPPAASV